MYFPPGDYSEVATPVPIPNTVVKHLHADDTKNTWESRKLLGLCPDQPNGMVRAFLFFLFKSNLHTFLCTDFPDSILMLYIRLLRDNCSPII